MGRVHQKKKKKKVYFLVICHLLAVFVPDRLLTDRFWKCFDCTHLVIGKSNLKFTTKIVSTGGGSGQRVSLHSAGLHCETHS